MSDLSLMELSCEPYVAFPGNVRTGTPEKVSVQAHVIFATASCLAVTNNWPLREYYVYMDIDPSDGVDFETMGLLWTDEHGFPHYTDGNGKPTERVPSFVVAWSKKDSTNIERQGASLAIIYDKDPKRLEERKRQVVMNAGGGPLPEMYRMNMSFLESGDGKIHANKILVPENKDVLDIERITTIAKEAEALLEAVNKASKNVVDYISCTTRNKTFFFHRQSIDQWLDADQRLRGHLRKMPGGKSYYQEAYERFDEAKLKLVARYLQKLDALEAFLDDQEKMYHFGLLDMVCENLDDPAGEHVLWRHQWLCEALGAFAGTDRQLRIFNKFVHPLARFLSVPFGPARNACKCKTCAMFVNAVTTLSDAPSVEGIPDLKKGHELWKAKDLKVGTRIGQRILDLMTKFNDNVAFIRAKNGLITLGSLKEWKEITFFSWAFFIKTGMITPSADGGALDQNAQRWRDFLDRQLQAVKKADGSVNEFVSEAKKLLEAKKTKVANLTKLTESISLLGSASVFYYFATLENRSIKDWVSFSGSIFDTAKSSIALGRGAAEAAITAKMGSDVAKKFTAAVTKWTPRISAASGALTLTGSYLSLHDAAEKGDSREFWWASVQYTGSSISMAGLVLDVMPEPLVTKGLGVTLNFAGGVIYAVGAAGEFLTRPDDVEVFLRNEGFWQEESDYTPPVREPNPWRPHPGKI